MDTNKIPFPLYEITKNQVISKFASPFFNLYITL